MFKKKENGFKAFKLVHNFDNDKARDGHTVIFLLSNEKESVKTSVLIFYLLVIFN